MVGFAKNSLIMIGDLCIVRDYTCTGMTIRLLWKVLGMTLVSVFVTLGGVSIFLFLLTLASLFLFDSLTGNPLQRVRVNDLISNPVL